jgi:aminopeptidase N
VCLRVEGETSPRCVLLEGKPATVQLARCPAFVHPNATEAGYYRYDLDESSWKKLASSFASLDETERAGLILDSWALVLAGRRGAEHVVGLLVGIDWKKERSRVVVEAAISVLAEIDRTLVDDATRPGFIKLVRRVLDPTRKRLGMPAPGKSEPADTALLRVSVMAALFDLAKDADVARALTPAGKQYLDDPSVAQASIGPDLGPLAARVAVASDSAVALALDDKRLAAAKTPDHRVGLTVAMASRRDAAALRSALDLLRSGSIRAGDVRHVKNAVATRPESRAVFYAWATEHFDELSAKLGGPGTLSSTLGWACGNEPEAVKLAAAVRTRIDKLEGARRGLEEGGDESARCGTVRARERQAFSGALKK